MGPTLARLAKRAAPDKTIFAVARFTQDGLQKKLEDWGIETIKADLLDTRALAGLPKPKNIIFMAGRKFGSSSSWDHTWAVNVLCPALVARHSFLPFAAFGCAGPLQPKVSGNPFFLKR